MANNQPKSDVAVIPRSFNPIDWTNANKVQIGAFINALIAVLMVFGVSLDTAQQGALIVLVNAGLALFGSSTAGSSPVAKLAARRTAGKSGTL